MHALHTTPSASASTEYLLRRLREVEAERDEARRLLRLTLEELGALIRKLRAVLD